MSKIVGEKTILGANTISFHVDLSSIRPNFSFDEMMKYYADAKGESKSKIKKDMLKDGQEPAAD